MCMWSRFSGSSSHFSALDLSDAGSAVHTLSLPQPLLQSPEEHQTLCQHGSEKHFYQWPAARSRWDSESPPPMMGAFSFFFLANDCRLHTQDFWINYKVILIHLCNFLLQQEFPSVKPSWWVWYLLREQVPCPETCHFLCPREAPGMTSMITSGTITSPGNRKYITGIVLKAKLTLNNIWSFLGPWCLVVFWCFYDPKSILLLILKNLSFIALYCRVVPHLVLPQQVSLRGNKVTLWFHPKKQSQAWD